MDRPPEAGAQVRILPGAHCRGTAGGTSDCAADRQLRVLTSCTDLVEAAARKSTTSKQETGSLRRAVAECEISEAVAIAIAAAH